MQNQFLSTKSPHLQKRDAPKVVIVIPPMRIPRNFHCEINESPDNYNSNNPDRDNLTDIGFLHKHPDYKPHKTLSFHRI